MRVQSNLLPPETTGGNSHRRLLLIALGSVVLWAVLMFASQVLWQQVFGFSASEAWALAVWLSFYIALTVVVMFAVVLVVGREE
jgi:hypothetical protein